jgi:hypothetical protein
MKKLVTFILLISICLCTTKRGKAQGFQDKTLIGKPIKTWIYPIDTTKKNLGPVTLYELKDSSITVCDKLLPLYLLWPSECKTLDIPVIEINKIGIRDGNKTWSRACLGSLICAATGFGIGYYIGYRGGDDTGHLFALSAEEKGAIGGGLGAFCGAITGAIIGASIKIYIPINGDLGNYKMSKDKIRKYSVH